MPLWTRTRRRATPAEEENVLVISDIHLGEDLVATGPAHLSGHIRALNRELADFIATHGNHGHDGRRWHLVIDGDMFDFLKISLRPDAEQTPAAGFMRNLPNTPENVVWKLERILEIHRPLFKQMGIFLLEGHRITIIEGNHDGEFYFEAVRETLRRALIREAEREQARRRPGRLFDGELIGARVAFRTWFEARSGRYHIEHGHQYDELCSFEHHLVPLEHQSATLATPMSHRLLPYFSELLGDFSTHGIDNWQFGTWMRWLWSKGPRTGGALLRMYAVAMWELLSRAGGKRRRELSAMQRAHVAELRALAERTPYGLETLERLDRLKAPPAEYSFTKMVNVFCIDRFMVIGGAAALLGAAAFTGGGAGAMLGAGGLAVSAAALWVMGRPRREIHDVLRQAAARIADATGARYVVFGHSHHPELIDLRARFGVARLSGGAYYINSGSWVTREIIAGDSGKGMTYVEIGAEAAYLKRWRGRAQPPQVLASSHDPAAHEPAA